MTDIKIFNHEEFGSVRTMVFNEEPWFLGKDVAEILGYERPQKAVKDLVDVEDLKTLKYKACPNLGLWSDPDYSDKTIINEAGVYDLIMRSKLPQAKKFKRWVTSEVLPSIRKYGAYATKETINKIIADPDFGINLLNQLKEEKAKRALVEAENQRNKPKVLFADTVSASKSSCLVGELAKLIKQEANRRGMNLKRFGQNILFEWLRNNGYLCKSGERKNQPTQRYIDSGLFEMKKGSYVDSSGNNIVTTTTKVTGKGQIYFINKFLG